MSANDTSERVDPCVGRMIGGRRQAAGAPAMLVAMAAVCGTIASCAIDDRSGGPAIRPVPTLTGAAPLVIGHRGLPGLYPEETLPSYEAAVDAGADSLEEDLHLTKDCVLVARHNPWLGDNTNIAAVAQANPAVAARRRIVPGRRIAVGYPAQIVGGPADYPTDRTSDEPRSVLASLVVDGEDHVGDWAISDFTLDELKRWIGGTTYDAADERPARWNGVFPIVTMQEIIDLARARSATTGRTITVYPEAKNPVWNDAQAVANGCGRGAHPFEDAIVKLVVDNHLNSRSAPIFVQSFDPASLRYMRSIGLATRVVQLVSAAGVDYRTGEPRYATNTASSFTDGRPYSWTVAGDGRHFDALLTPAGLAEVRTYADGIGPWKPQVVRLTRAGGNSAVSPLLADVDAVAVGRLVDHAHAAGLFVHVFTFRDEPRYLAGVYRGDPVAEYLTFYRAGVDGVFTDFAHTAVRARAIHQKQLSGSP